MRRMTKTGSNHNGALLRGRPISFSYMRKILLVNGPPDSGKDTIGKLLAEKHGFHVEKFAAPIRAAMCTLFGIDDNEIEELKGTMIMGGHSLREWMIGYSEDYLKKFGGESVFGHLLIDRLESIPADIPVVITDSGFYEEGVAVVEKYGAENVAMIQVMRPGHTFDGDSRDWVFLDGVDTVVLHNNGTIEQLEALLTDIINEYLFQEHVQ